jgi:phytoene desaturase
VWFPKGGTGQLISGLVALFKDIGGKFELNAAVTKIETSGSRVTGVTTHDGRTFPADLVLSNADVVHTYRDLLGQNLDAQRATAKLMKRRFSMSLFVIYFGLKRQHDIKHHTVLFGPRYRELISEIFKGPELADDFSLYLHAPTVSDPSLAPPGCSSYYVLSPVPHLGSADIDWSVEGPKYRDRILGYLEEKILPGLREDLITCRIFTPFDFRDELNAHLGSAFSLEPILLQSAYFRVHNSDDKIGGLYFVGAGTHPGAGVPGVVGSAKATAGVVLRDLGLQPVLS